jgi:hypothetical protein
MAAAPSSTTVALSSMVASSQPAMRGSSPTRLLSIGGSSQHRFADQLCSGPRAPGPSGSFPTSYSEAVKTETSARSFPSVCSVKEAPAISLRMGQEAEDEEVYFRENALICRFNGFWPRLVDLNGWISAHWKPLIKEDLFIHPCPKGFFIAEFDLAADRDLILASGPWFWGNSGLCLMVWTPCFNPLNTVLSSAPVWVRLPNLPLHFWGETSLRDIGSALGKFYFASKETRIHSTTSYARICVEMDFSKGFPAEIILGCKNYTWTQKLDYERISLRCRACFETGHTTAQCTKGNRKAGKQQRKSTWWEGSNEDHQLIITNTRKSSLESDPPSLDSKGTSKNVPHPKSKASISLDSGIESIKASDTPDTRKESKVLFSPPPPSSWADEADEDDKDEATLTSPKKTSPPYQGNMGIIEPSTISLPAKEGWITVEKRKKTPPETQPMTTRSRSGKKK